MPKITLDIDVYCDECGEELVTSFAQDTLYVDPCDTCVSNASNTGFDEGFDRGIQEGLL